MTPASPPAALALSPHLDDAAFSAGGTLAELAQAGWRVVVATVFTRSIAGPRGFALACQLDKGLPADLDYMALRRDEDAAACRRLGAEPRWLPLPEAPHRGYHSAPALFAGLHANDAVVADLVPLLGDLVRELQPALILAPQAIGGHVDHRALVQALAHVIDAAPVLWWRDYPYVDRDAPVAPFAERFAGLHDVQVPLAPASSAAKLDAALAYRSQIGFQFGGVDALLRRFTQAEPVERFKSRRDRSPVRIDPT